MVLVHAHTPHPSDGWDEVGRGVELRFGTTKHLFQTELDVRVAPQQLRRLRHLEVLQQGLGLCVGNESVSNLDGRQARVAVSQSHAENPEEGKSRHGVVGHALTVLGRGERLTASRLEALLSVGSTCSALDALNHLRALHHSSLKTFKEDQYKASEAAS